MATPFHGNTLNQLSIGKAAKFVEQIDNITENAPIIKIMPFTQSTDQLWDVSSEIRLISSVNQVDLNAPLPEIQMADALKQTQLNIFGAMSFVPEDTATLEGGASNYFARNRPTFEKQTGMDMEQSYIYNAFLPFALNSHFNHEESVYDAGGSNDQNFSIICCRFDSTNLSGLYSPLAFKRTTFLDIAAINGGNMYVNPDVNSKFYNVLGYGMRMKTYVGVRMLSPRNIAAIVNIDLNEPTPFTVKTVNEMLLSARVGESGSSFIMCHPRVKLYLDEIGKTERLMTNFVDQKANFEITSWNGVPIVTSYNFVDGAEANIAL